MIRKRNLFYFFLMLLMVLLIVNACSNQSDSNNKDNNQAGGTIEDNTNENTPTESFNASGMPIVNQPLTLNFFAGRHPSNADDYNEVLLWKEYSAMTGINIDWNLVPNESLEEKRSLALASDNLPDVFYMAQISTNDLFKYGQQGTFIDLTDLIEEHMPNLKGLLEEYPEVRKGITFPNDGIYGFPGMFSPEFTSVLAASKLWIRQDWLDQLDMDVPEDLDEFYDYLKAVKETDLNENGENDEIPYGAYRLIRLKEWLAGSFGLGNRGMHNQNVDMDPDTETLRFYPIADESKELLEYLNKLYSEELIANNIYTLDQQQNLAAGSEGLYGSTVDQHPQTSFGDEGGDFIGIAPFKGPHGDQLARYVSAPTVWPGGMVITKDNEYPEVTARWMDFFYGEEGRKMFFMGIEGESYEETEEGVKYLDIITNNPDGLTMPEARSKYVTYAGGGYPGIVDQRYYQGTENNPAALEAMDRIEPYLIDEVWPEFIYTEDERKVLTSNGADIEKYVEEMEDRFITGEKPFSEWDDYVKELKNMGLDNYLKIKTDAYERYMNN